jgi:multisubunit Na+/H+ antiporter MnhG subunit
LRIIKIITSLLGTVIVILAILGIVKKGKSVYKDNPEEQNPF